MISASHKQDGFTAVELLVTLIVASMFLFAGYQLYTQVTRDGGGTTRAAIVSGKVYEKLRLKSADSTISGASSCTSALETPTPTPVVTETLTGVGSVNYETEVRCPDATDSLDIFRIKVKATYTEGGVSKTVEHATYVD